MELMKITGYIDEEFLTVFEGKPYSFMINPETVRLQRSISYNDQQSVDLNTASPKYKSTPSEKLNFDIVIDCTGIVDGQRTQMADEIEALEKLVFNYNSDIQRPNFVKIQWGKDFLFKGVLKSLDTSFTLFRSDGSALRAKISLAFDSYVSLSTLDKKNAKKAFDINRSVTVAEGDSLPQLCQNIWNDDSKYVQVAKYNNLNKFRNLTGVDNLIFPPIV